MVLMEHTRRAAVERSGISGTQGGMNRFNHALEFPTEKFRQVIRPNADTLYSSSWIDLSKEPVMLHVPATERYYLMQLMDAWTEDWDCGSSVVRIVRPPWFQTFARASLVFPNIGLVRNTSRT